MTHKLYKPIYLCLVICSYCCSMLSADNLSPVNEISPLLTIVSERNYPLNYKDDKDAEIKGYVAELIKAVMDNTGLKYEISIKPWSRVLNEAFTNKNTLIYSVGRTPERENKLLWIGKVITVENYIYGLSETHGNSEYSMADLKKSNISVSKNSLNYTYLKNNNFKHLISVNNYEQTYQLLKRNRIQFFTSSIIGAQQFVVANNLQPHDIVRVMKLHETNPTLYFAANLKTAPEIIDKVKTSFQNIIDDGTYSRIMSPLLGQQKELRNITN